MGDEQREREVESKRERLRAREKGRLIRDMSGWRARRKRSESRERSGEQFVLSPSPSLFFLLLPSFFFLHLWSLFFVHPPKFLLPPFPKFIVPPFSKLFSDGFVIFPLMEQKKYWVYPLQQICGLGFRFVEMRHFCFPYWRIFDKVWIFFVTVLFKSESRRSVVENNHSKAESAGLVFLVYVRSRGFVNVNLHFSALLCYPSPYTNLIYEANMLNSQNLRATTFMWVRENNVMQKSAGSHLQ